MTASETRIVVAQIDIESLAPTENLEVVQRTMGEAARHDPDLVVFPELVNLGQVSDRDRDFGERFLDLAERIPGPFCSAVAETAREVGCCVVFGMAELHPTIPGTVFNSAVVLNADGDVAGVQRKLQPAGEERHYFAAGDSIEVIPTDLGLLGVGICYDLYFPEVPRTAALRGSEMLVGIFNVTLRPDWPDRLAQLAAVRCYENMQPVVLVNRVGENHGRAFGGESAVAAPPGKVVLRAPVGEPAVLCTGLSPEALQRERSYRPVFADRRPELYDA